MDKKINILGIGGSLRKGSYNKALLDYAGEVCPKEAIFELFNKFDQFPPYNEDLRMQREPEIVKEFKEKIRTADALLFASPEYNFTLPGYLKNAIDWASRPAAENPFQDKPAGLMSASGGMLGGVRMQSHFRLMSVFLNIHFLNQPQVIVTFAGEKIKDGEIVDEHTKEKVKEMIIALIKWARRLQR